MQRISTATDIGVWGGPWSWSLWKPRHVRAKVEWYLRNLWILLKGEMSRKKEWGHSSSSWGMEVRGRTLNAVRMFLCWNSRTARLLPENENKARNARGGGRRKRRESSRRWREKWGGGAGGGRRRGGGREGKLVKEGEMFSLLFPRGTTQESKQVFFPMGWILVSSEHRQCLKPLRLLINCSVSCL